MSRLCSYFGNPWIGMFIITNDKFTMLPLDSMDKIIDKARENLRTEVIKASVAESNLIGIYCAMNSNGVVLPNLMKEEETAVFKEHGL